MNAAHLKEIRQKIFFTIAILVLYRFGTYIPLPHINTVKLAEFTAVAKSGVFGMFNMFSGGSVGRVSIFALGIMPYITSSIVVQLLVATTPSLKQMKNDGGEAGRRAINQYIKYLAILIGLVQGFMLSSGFVGMELYTGPNILQFKVMSAFIMMTSTMILIWLGEQCTLHGIGNGSSLIIFAGIVAESPRDLFSAFALSKSGNISVLMLIGLFAIFIATIVFVVLAERSNRLIYIQYPRQTHNFVGRKIDVPKQNFLPLKLNTAGVIPPIFASAVLLLPVTLVGVLGNDTNVGRFILTNLTHGKVLFILLYVTMILFFTFFYNSVIFEADEISENLKRSGVFIPGCRPGAPTSTLLRNILMKLSAVGGGYLVIICLIPELLSPIFGYSFLLGGTGVLIVVNVIIDTVVNIQTTMLYGKYEKMASKYSK